MMNNFLGVLFIFVLFSFPTLAQSVSGVVLAKDNKDAVGYATVSLITRDSTYINATVATEDGKFTLDTKGCADCLLKIIALGYKPSTFSLDSLRTVFFIEKETYQLKEVVKRASRRIVKMNRSGNLEVNVAGTHLANRNNIKELLLSVPGVVERDGNIITISGAAPLYVVNGRKVQSYAEIATLSVKDIKNIAVNNNPGVEYGGNVKAIIMITTSVPLDRLTLNTQATVRKSRAWSHNEYLNAIYAFKDVTLYGTLQYASYKKKSFQNIAFSSIDNTSVPLFLSHTNLVSYPSDIRKLNYNFGVDWQLASSHKLSLMFDGFVSRINDTGNATNDVINRSESKVSFHSLSKLNDKLDYKHVALNYNYTDKRGLAFSLAADYAATHSKRIQNTEEVFSNSNEVTNVANRVTNNLFSINPHFIYPLHQKLSAQLGGQFDYITNENRLEYSRSMQKRNSETKELISAAYMGLTYQGNHYQAQIGMRYENTRNTFQQDTQKTEQNSSQLLPYASLSFSLGNTSHQISFKYDMQRPPLGFIGGYSYYLNRYKFQEGNPMLRPQRNSTLDYALSWNNFYFSAKYQYVKSPIMALSTLVSSSDYDMVKSSWYNLEKQHNITVMMNYSKSFDWYKPSLTLAYIHHINYLATKHEHTETLSRPVPYLQMQNTLVLPWLDVNVNYEYTGKGYFRVFLTEERHLLNLSVQKRLLHEALSVSLYWNDVFRQDISRYEVYYQGLLFRQTEDQDRQIIGLTVSYRFNSKQRNQQIKSSDQLLRL